MTDAAFLRRYLDGEDCYFATTNLHCSRGNVVAFCTGVTIVRQVRWRGQVVFLWNDSDLLHASAIRVLRQHPRAFYEVGLHIEPRDYMEYAAYSARQDREDMPLLVESMERWRALFLPHWPPYDVGLLKSETGRDALLARLNRDHDKLHGLRMRRQERKEDRLKAQAKAALPKWRRGGDMNSDLLYRAGNVLRICGDRIEMPLKMRSEQIQFVLPHLSLVKKLITGVTRKDKPLYVCIPLGGYTINKIAHDSVQIGCRVFPIAEIKRIIKQLEKLPKPKKPKYRYIGSITATAAS